MGQCESVLTSGPNKGVQCSNRVKPGGNFCGVHRKMTQQPQHESESCPDQLRPRDGQCPPKFPNQRQLPDGSTCCWGLQFQKIRKMRPRKRTRQIDTDLIYPKKCVLRGYLLEYLPELELSPRPVNIFGSDCEAMGQALLQEFPSLAWLNAQTDYFRTLNKTDIALIQFYTYHGDVILNNFVRNRWSISENDLDFIRLRCGDESINEGFHKWMKILKLTDMDSVELLLLGIYNRLNQLIMKAPSNSQRFVSYRGSNSKDYFEQVQTQKPKIFRNMGFFSTTMLIANAMAFAQGGYMTRIIVPKGYHCIYLEAMTLCEGEEEILMPDQTQYFVTSGFQEQKYGPDISIPTNELVMVQTSPKQATIASLQSQHPIRDLLLDITLRRKLSKIINGVNLSRLYTDRLSIIWLRRLSDHQIYTLKKFRVRGIQLQPTLTELGVDP